MYRVWLTLMLLIIVTSNLQAERLVYHDIQTDEQGHIVPWFSPDPGKSYDHVLGLVWNFWINMPNCPNGEPYYMQHMVWDPEGCYRHGIGGDQFAFALSSWQLLYNYTGDPAVLKNMAMIADYYLERGLSPPDAAWPNMPYPYNTEIHSRRYDGDMMAGKGYIQPDKAGSFGAELITLYKMTGNEKYRKAATRIAETMLANMVHANDNHSPWPFRVHAETGKLPPPEIFSAYTTNWTGTLRLFDEMIATDHEKADEFRRIRGLVIWWLRNYPIKMNKWGPFFEDIDHYSDCEINADTMAWYILESPDWGRSATRDARAILDWSKEMFSNYSWEKYGVVSICEQSSYLGPGNSHTARHASVELIYCAKTGDETTKNEAIRQLNWATYMVNEKGESRYPNNDIWLTDGYVDYVRHYLRAMAAFPELAPAGQNHLLHSTSVIKKIAYEPKKITYDTFDLAGQETLRIAFTPTTVTVGETALPRLTNLADLKTQQGFTFEAQGDARGVLRIRRDNASTVEIKE